MRRVLVFGLVTLLLVGMSAQSFAATRPAKAQDVRTGTLKGVATDSKGQKLAGVKVRVRHSATGAIAAEAVRDVAGGFSVAGLAPASYIVEVVSVTSEVIGLSSAVALTAGATATVTVTAALGAMAGGGAAGAGLSVLGLGTAASLGVIGAAATAAVVGVKAARRDASPSGQ
jgi:hypothetical protein